MEMQKYMLANVGRVKSVLTNGADFQKFMKHYLFFRFIDGSIRSLLLFSFICVTRKLGFNHYMLSDFVIYFSLSVFQERSVIFS